MTQDELTYKVFTDGGSRGNPGPAAYGFVIYNPTGEVVAEEGKYIGVTTNNQAEYQGIAAALDQLAAMPLDYPVVCSLDSQLVVRQINGQYKMKNEGLKPWLDKVRTTKSKLSVPVTFIDIRREHNKHADHLVNRALDGFEKGDT